MFGQRFRATRHHSMHGICLADAGDIICRVADTYGIAADDTADLGVKHILAFNITAHGGNLPVSPWEDGVRLFTIPEDALAGIEDG